MRSLRQRGSVGHPPEVFAELDRINRLLECLPAEARIVFILRRVEHLSLAEVAARVDRSLATVKRRLVGAERLLRSKRREVA